MDSNVNLKPIKIGNSDELSFGDNVYAIGNGSNYGLALTHGSISIPKINVEYEDITREVIQSDITISAGNSGGALLDDRGNLIGITSFRTLELFKSVLSNKTIEDTPHLDEDIRCTFDMYKGELVEIFENKITYEEWNLMKK